MEKVEWNSIDKKQNVLKYSKNDKSSTLPRQSEHITECSFIHNSVDCEIWKLTHAEHSNVRCKAYFNS